MPSAHRSQASSKRAEYSIGVSLVRPLHSAQFGAAELGDYDLPGLMRDRDRNHKRTARMRVQGRCGPAPRARSRRRMLAEEFETAKPSDGLCDVTAGHLEFAAERGPLDAGLTMYKAQHSDSSGCSPQVRHQHHVAILLVIRL